VNALVKIDVPSLAMSEGELIKVLEASIYPGAAIESIKLVIGYCRAQHLDPMLKPVHIVPMDVKVKLPQKTDGKDFKYVKRDVVMPGIGLYRIQAARTGEYAGISAPEFGPTQKMTWKEKYQEDENGPQLEREVAFEYPEWCRMTVRRIVAGHVVEFTATEYWLENYATKSRDSKHPNAMWAKRSRGQIAKCTEAQALRKAFPEIGAQPTADEIEGKTLETDPDGNVIDGRTGQVVRPAIPPLMVGEQPGSAAPAADPANPQAPAQEPGAGASGAAPDRTEGPLLTDGERAHIKQQLDKAGLTEVDLKAKFNVGLDGLQQSQFKAVKAWIKAPAAAS
jgi:phage recombination protein Bet